MIKEHIPLALKNQLKRFWRRTQWKGSRRVFCISMQRNGTTSVGKFFAHFGYPVAGWNTSKRNQWSKAWYSGDFESILKSKDFLSYQVFEDDPWWLPEFYKVLYHRFPDSQFVLFTRDSDAWFRSMLSHSNGKTIGNTQGHCKAYRREKEFYDQLDDHKINPTRYETDNLLPLAGFEQHYRDIYEVRNREIVDFFAEKAPDSLFTCDLKDKDKWKKLGDFVGIDVPENFEVHSNQSTRQPFTAKGIG